MNDIPLINFTNYTEHPEDRNIMVFTFKKRAAGIDFEDGLIEQGIWYEKDTSGTKEHPEMMLFAVRKQDYKAAMRQNYLTTARHRKPFMADRLFRYTVVTITVTLVTLAIIGWIVVGV